MLRLEGAGRRGLGLTGQLARPERVEALRGGIGGFNQMPKSRFSLTTRGQYAAEAVEGLGPILRLGVLVDQPLQPLDALARCIPQQGGRGGPYRPVSPGTFRPAGGDLIQCGDTGLLLSGPQQRERSVVGGAHRPLRYRIAGDEVVRRGNGVAPQPVGVIDRRAIIVADGEAIARGA